VRTHRELSATLDPLRTIARQHGLSLLVLFGSRARGDALVHGDWDLGYLAADSVDPLALTAALAESLGTERVDLVDLGRASGLLRYRAARDGIPVYEAQKGSFDRFRFEAARFWFDAEPVLRAGYDAILDRLG
jgi:predicted nucleotidyltransferase